MIENNKKSQEKQKKILIITLVGVAVVIIAFLSSGGKKPNNDLSKIINESKDQIILQNPNHGVNAEDMWLENAEQKMDNYEKFQKDYEQDKGNIETRLGDIEKKYEDTINTQTGLIESQGNEIEQLKNQLNTAKTPAPGNKQDPFAQGGAAQNPYAVAPSKAIQTTEIDLEKVSETEGEFFKSSEYVPAGAYAEATIISGVDASVGAAAQSDPRPVLLRIKGPAFSSIYEGHAQKANLTGCLITGAASGDLSSEKVYVKLVNMTCAKSEDLIYETAVKGYVAGQGKSGVRGDVISRAGDIVAKTFLSGLIGGFGQGLSAKVAPPLNFSNGLTTQGVMSSEDVAKKGLGQGFASSGDRLANYYIQRAEQYQPVVSIPSGLDVEVVFVEGFKLNGKRHRTASTPSNKFINKFEGGQ